MPLKLATVINWGNIQEKSRGNFVLEHPEYVSSPAQQSMPY
jgi:hypothetical protein